MATTVATSKAPTPTMSSGRAMLSYSLAVILDTLKFIFATLMFAAPFIAAAAAKLYLEGQGWPSWVASIASVAAGSGTALIEIVQPEIAAAIAMAGIVLAMAIGFLGWLILLGLFFLWGIDPFGSRNLFRVMIGWVASEIPVVNLFPTFTPSVWSIVKEARRKDAEAKTEWEKENAKQQALMRAQRQRNQQVQQAQLIQAQQVQEGGGDI